MYILHEAMSSIRKMLYCKCKIANDKKMVAEAKAHADQIKMAKFQCCCDADEDTECDYCFEMMIEQDRLENPNTSSHECSNCGDHVDNVGLCYCYRNTVRNSRSYGVKTCKP